MTFKRVVASHASPPAPRAPGPPPGGSHSHRTRFRMTQHDWSRTRWALLSLVPAFAVWFSPASALAEKPEAQAAAEKPAKPAKLDAQLDTEPAQFIRFVDDDKGGGKLDVATATYKNDSGVTVHLVGVVHIGDKKYYQ